MNGIHSQSLGYNSIFCRVLWSSFPSNSPCNCSPTNADSHSIFRSFTCAQLSSFFISSNLTLFLNSKIPIVWPMIHKSCSEGCIVSSVSMYCDKWWLTCNFVMTGVAVIVIIDLDSHQSMYRAICILLNFCTEWASLTMQDKNLQP